MIRRGSGKKFLVLVSLRVDNYLKMIRVMGLTPWEHKMKPRLLTTSLLHWKWWMIMIVCETRYLPILSDPQNWDVVNDPIHFLDNNCIFLIPSDITFNIGSDIVNEKTAFYWPERIYRLDSHTLWHLTSSIYLTI